MQNKKNIILIDWFAMSFRQKGISPYEIIDMLKLDKYKGDIHFMQRSGRYMYRDKLSFGNIHIYYNNINEKEDYPMLELTGQGCREFETFSSRDFDFLFSLAHDEKNFHMTRLDLAYDDTTGVFPDMEVIFDDFRFKNWVSNCIKGKFSGDVDQSRDKTGLSVMTGTKSSDIYMRIYDKAIERKFTDGRHWIRCELVLKQQRASNFIKDPRSIGDKYSGVIADYFRFITPNKTDTNKRRWKTRKYWSDFLGDAEKISLYTPKDIEYNLSMLHRYVFGQAGNSVDTYIKCVGLVKFLEDLLERDTKLNPKQKYLIEQSKTLIECGETVDTALLEELSQHFNQ